jgi:hypothetical protein
MMMQTKIQLPLILLASMLWCGSGVSAGGQLGLGLMRPDSLVGWDYGSPPPAPGDWTLADGRLSGTARSTPLLSGWTFGDFEIGFQWSVADGGAWNLSLPEVPSGKGLELILREGPDCGRLTDGDTELSPGGEVKPQRKMHTAGLRRAGRKLSFTVDGRWLYEIDLKPDRRFGLGLALVEGKGSLAHIRLREPPGKPLFNGKDLTGWWTKGDITKWRVRKGRVELTGRAGDYLRAEKPYANFTWSFEIQMQRRANSGLSVRTPRDGWPTSDGMELQLLDRPYNAPITDEPYMAVYGHVPPLGRADKSEKWNRVVVKADGWMISAWVNGELVQQVNTFFHPELKHRPLEGWIGFQDHGSWIRVRNVMILEAPAGLGLSAWYQPRAPLGTAAVLDRLLNPERLSAADGIRSGVAYKVISGDQKGEHVLADLNGPGAVVRIARTGGQGRLAFYFDGEQEPKIQCTPGELARTIPRVGKDSSPMLTCLTYRKNLRIVLHEAGTASQERPAGEYRFDYVTLPRGLPVESLADPEQAFPRGWLSTTKTHLRWIGSGKFHEYDGLPRFGAQPQTIQPGQTAELVHVDGTGMVKALKLLADKGVLENNDLWLEETVDGEPRPALSAPVRYVFPSLTRNYDNYVLADQGGPTSFLAMPFGKGITVAVANRGGRPIPGVGLSLSVEKADERTGPDIAGRMRLRGVFRSAQDGNSELINQKGSGRWVGLVYQQPHGEPTAIATLLVDGRPVDGWSAPNLDAFLGESGEFRRQLSGRQGPLCWRYLLLAPVDFQQSLVLKDAGNQVGERLALFYMDRD